MNSKIELIKSQIAKYATIILLRHNNPDGDALGCVLGLGFFLQQHFPHKKILEDGDNNSKYLSFLGHLPRATATDYQGALVIICDAAETKRIDSAYYQNSDYIIKIDHHPDRDPYGALNWVEPDRIAACELVAELVRSYKQPLPIMAAQALYVGIITDSNRFMFANTSPRTLELAAYLMSFIPDISKVYDHLYNIPMARYKLKIHIMQGLKTTKSGIGYATFRQSQIDKLKTDYIAIKSMVNVFSMIKEIKVWFIAVDNIDDGNIKISIRSRGVDVAQVTHRFGGGGHAHAAACYLDNWNQLATFINDIELTMDQAGHNAG